MTIDEAIKHAEKEAEEQDKLCKRYDDASGFTRSHNEEIRTSAAKQCEKCADEHRQLAEWLKELKQLREQTKWIPVSERLPEENMPCLVSAGKLCLTQIAMYSDLMGTIDHRIFYQGEYGHESFADITQYVIAWMPLPKPYRAESETQK